MRKFIPKVDPTLAHAPLIAKHFDVSKEAVARAYARYHPEQLAIVVIKDDKVRRAHKGPTSPWISAPYGEPMPRVSGFYAKEL